MQFGLARRPRRRLRWNSRSPEGWAGPSPEVATWASRSSPWWRPPHRVRTPRRATRTAPPGGSSRRSTRSSLRVGSVRCRPLLAVAHTAGLPSPQLRLLDRLLTAARQQGGRASMSQDWIGIGSAMADPDDHLHTFRATGWVTVVHTPESGEWDCHHRPTGSTAPSLTTPPPPRSSGGFQRFLEGHDAFGAGPACCTGLPLLSLLDQRPCIGPTWPGGCRCPRTRPAGCWRPR